MTEKKKMPKGGRKGGTRFPQIALNQAVEFAKKLVAKTHTGPQPENIVLKGVFNNSGPGGQVRASALKQFDLLEGEADAYTGTKLARDINSAPQEELPPLLHRAFIAPKIFKDLFDTFQNDTVSRAKLRQQALQLGIHPDNGEKCVDLFVESAIYAGVGQQSGEDLKLSQTPILPKSTSADMPVDEGEESVNKDDDPGDEVLDTQDRPKTSKKMLGGGKMTISLSLDSTMDPERLEKYLKLLRDYGAID